MSPGRIIALGFFTIILIGALLFMLPISQRTPGSLSFTDALFTSTSAVCVTGLSVFDPGSTLTPFGQAVLAILIQLGGLGFISISTGIVLFTGQKVFLKQRILVKEALNYGSMGGIITLVKSVLATTFLFELAGAVIFFFTFIKEYSLPRAIGLSLFHAVSSFNNAGFDILGKGDNLISMSDNTVFVLTTALMIIFGGIGFLVIKELAFKHKFRKFTLHTKIVLCMTAFLLVAGTVLFKLTESYGWLDAFFMSVSTRTAGFTTVELNDISNAGLIVYALLMFIGASPTSTGGGIKTTTVFVVIAALYSYFSANKPSVFKRTLSKDTLYKAFIIVSLGFGIVLLSLFFSCAFNPTLEFKDIFFEVFSAFGTAGLSTGITSLLSTAGKYTIIITMFIGRLGPLTIVSLWAFKKRQNISYAVEGVTLG